MTPNDLLYTEGVRMWPSRTTWEHYGFVLQHSAFPTFFKNSLIVSASTAVVGHDLRLAVRLRAVALHLPGEILDRGADAADPDVPAGHAGRADLQDAVAAAT